MQKFPNDLVPTYGLAEPSHRSLPDDIDPRIRPVVELLNDAGLRTISSCQGGEGHGFAAPTVRIKPNEPTDFDLSVTADRCVVVLLALGYTGFTVKRVEHYQSTSQPYQPEQLSYVEVEFWSDWKGLKADG